MAITIKPKMTTGGLLELDMRDSPLLAEELAQQILESVDRTQRFVVTQLPDLLTLTMDQFNSLLADMTDMYNAEYKVYVTPLNAMEVRVLDGEFNQGHDSKDR